MTDDPLNEALDALERMVERHMPHPVDGFSDHESMTAGEPAADALALAQHRPTRWRVVPRGVERRPGCRAAVEVLGFTRSEPRRG